MKVKELITELKKFNQDFEVLAIDQQSYNSLVTHYKHINKVVFKPYMTDSVYLISTKEDDEKDDS